MKYNETNYNKIDIKDNFMFCTVMRKPELCKEFLERVLGISIKKIQYVDGEKSIDIAIDAKSIRLDVYLNDEKGTVYDLEMQKSDTLEIPKRSRYYSSLIDLALNDGTMKAFLNIKGDLTEVSNQMKSLLQYFDTGLISDEFTASLDKEVISTKNNEQWRLKYVTMQNALTEKYIIGRKEGLAEGQLTSVLSMLKKGFVTKENAAEQLNISIEELERLLVEYNH